MSEEDIPIENSMLEVNKWGPYRFLEFIEKELEMNGITYQPLDVTFDLGIIKRCLSYANKAGKPKASFVKYFLWITAGIEDTELSNLNYLLSSLKSYYGFIKGNVKPHKKNGNDKEVGISSGMKTWLNNLKNK